MISNTQLLKAVRRVQSARKKAETLRTCSCNDCESMIRTLKLHIDNLEKAIEHNIEEEETT